MVKDFSNINQLDYTTEELEYFETEMRKFRLPLICRLWKKYGLYFLSYSIIPVMVILTVLFVIYNHAQYGYDWIWILCKSIVLFYIFGVGGSALISHLLELFTVNKLRKRLGLSKFDFQIFVNQFQITGM
jgi:hypothetical protein